MSKNDDDNPRTPIHDEAPLTGTSPPAPTPTATATATERSEGEGNAAAARDSLPASSPETEQHKTSQDHEDDAGEPASIVPQAEDERGNSADESRVVAASSDGNVLVTAPAEDDEAAQGDALSSALPAIDQAGSGNTAAAPSIPADDPAVLRDADEPVPADEKEKHYPKGAVEEQQSLSAVGGVPSADGNEGLASQPTSVRSEFADDPAPSTNPTPASESAAAAESNEAALPAMSASVSQAEAEAPGMDKMPSQTGSEAAASASGSTSTTTTTSAAAPSATHAPAPAAKPIVPKKFTSSLSMNRKFLEKSGAALSDGKLPVSSSPALPKPGPAASVSPGPSQPGSSTASPTVSAATSISVPSAVHTSTSPASSSTTAASTLPVASSLNTTTSSQSASHPRLLTGKLSALGSGSGLGASSFSASSAAGLGGSAGGGTATWGRPAGTPSTAFGRAGTGFVPAPPVGGATSASAMPPTSAVPSMGAGRGRGLAFGRPGGPPSTGFGGTHQGMHRGAPWLNSAGGPGQGAGGGRALEHDFPSFQETARAEQQRQHAMVAKERAEKMAAAAQAAYNARVLEGLKSFSGVHADPSAPHWDEMDDDDDLEDILEFADGMRYEVPAHPVPGDETAAAAAIQPTEAEQKAFAEAHAASREAAHLQDQYERYKAEEEENEKKKGATNKKGPSMPDPRAVEDAEEDDTPVSKGERFVDDFDRSGAAAANRRAAGAPGSGVQRQQGAPGQPVPPSSGRDVQPGRTLFNDRLGRFEPYAASSAPLNGRGRGVGAVPKQQQQLGGRVTSPPAVLQRPPQARQPSATTPSGVSKPVNGQQQQQQPSQARRPSSPIAPKIQHQQQGSQGAASIAAPGGQTPSVPVAAKKVENAWAKPPTLAKLPPPGHEPSAGPPSAPAASLPIPAVSASIAATTTPQPQAQPVGEPEQPAEDPEEKYKREMQSIAERARKRRQEEEAEREARMERARKKAQELEEKMNAATAAAAAAAAPMSPPKPTAVLSPPAGPASVRPDKQASWRRTSVSKPTDAPVSIQQRILQPAKPAQQTQAVAPTQASASPTSKPIQSPPTPSTSSATVKPPPSSEAFAALADLTAASWRKPAVSVQPRPPPARTNSQAQEPVVEKQDTVLPEAVLPSTTIAAQAVKVANEAQAQALAPLLVTPTFAKLPVSTSDLTSPPPDVPRVRLGRSTPLPELQSEAIEVDYSKIPSHAFPQPTILVPQASTSGDAPSANIETRSPPQAKQEAPSQLSALEQIMLRVRAAQDGLSAGKANDREERRRAEAGKLDGALSRLSQAMAEAASPKGKRRDVPSSSEAPHVPYVPEVFDHTHIQRPPSPRIWKTFGFKLPVGKRPPYPPVAATRLRQFEHGNIPYAVFSTSWHAPREDRASQGLQRDEYLFPRPAKGTNVVVKVSQFHLPSIASPPIPSTEIELPAAVQSVRISPSLSEDRPGTGRSGAATWRRVDPPQPAAVLVLVEQESLTVADPPFGASISSTMLSGYDEEDFSTMPHDDFLEPPVAIKVSLPRGAAANPAIAPVAMSSSDLPSSLSPELNRFRAYGPKLPENSTVAFRRSISVNRDSTGVEPASSSMFMVSSEIGSDEAGLPHIPPSSTAAAAFDADFAALAATQGLDDFPNQSYSTSFLDEDEERQQQASPNLPAFPTLSPLPTSALPLPSSTTASATRKTSAGGVPTSFEVSRKIDIPKNVQEELDRLNATVSSAPLTVPSRLSSPGSFLGRTTSPWPSSTARAGSHIGTSAASGHFSLLDPSMSVWSRPTEETAAAAAAFASHAKGGEGAPENSLKDIADDFPSALPSNANDLQMTEGEASPKKKAVVELVPEAMASPAVTPAGATSRGDVDDEGVSKSKRLAAPGEMPSPYSGDASSHYSRQHGQYSVQQQQQQQQHLRRATHATSASSGSRHGSFAYPSASQMFGQDGAIPSPYAMPASLPYSSTSPVSHSHGHTSPATTAATTVYSSPSMHHHQYASYVPAGQYPHAYHPHAVPNGIYSHVPVAMHGGRAVPATLASQGGVWIQTSGGAPGIVNGHYTASAPSALSPYPPSQVSAYPGQPLGMASKGRVHPQQAIYGTHRAPSHSLAHASGNAAAYAPYGHQGQAGQTAVSPSYSAFSPQLVSPTGMAAQSGGYHRTASVPHSAPFYGSNPAPPTGSRRVPSAASGHSQPSW